MSDVTQILNAIEEGDPKAAEQLLPLVYAELRKLAAQKLAQEKPGQTLDATALVHEAYLRLVGDRQFADRRHFFAAAAQAMRHILVDAARRKHLLPRVDWAARSRRPRRLSKRGCSPACRWRKRRRRWDCPGPPPTASGRSRAPGSR